MWEAGPWAGEALINKSGAVLMEEEEVEVKVNKRPPAAELTEGPFKLIQGLTQTNSKQRKYLKNLSWARR